MLIRYGQAGEGLGKAERGLGGIDRIPKLFLVKIF